MQDIEAKTKQLSPVEIKKGRRIRYPLLQFEKLENLKIPQLDKKIETSKEILTKLREKLTIIKQTNSSIRSPTFVSKDSP